MSGLEGAEGFSEVITMAEYLLMKTRSDARIIVSVSSMNWS